MKQVKTNFRFDSNVGLFESRVQNSKKIKEKTQKRFEEKFSSNENSIIKRRFSNKDLDDESVHTSNSTVKTVEEINL
jgi:hypothetical protein